MFGKMKLTDFYSKVIGQEPYNDMGVFFSSYESFEEIPLVSRYSRLAFLQAQMSSDRVSDFLTGLAVFLLNSIKALTAAGADNKHFYAVTYTDFEALEEQGVAIPNIFVYPKPSSIGFVEKLKSDPVATVSREMEEVRRHFSNCGVETLFDFYESRFYDVACGEDIVRVFAVPKSFENDR
ncbi:hypothetical protein PHLH6_38100 [Pseudomonas sp. Seg1]|nr:hypothetical protein PHLH6_38100 [Pseudomonas sp. Seg1]